VKEIASEEPKAIMTVICRSGVMAGALRNSGGKSSETWAARSF
jgi:hypothetical protein